MLTVNQPTGIIPIGCRSIIINPTCKTSIRTSTVLTLHSTLISIQKKALLVVVQVLGRLCSRSRTGLTIFKSRTLSTLLSITFLPVQRTTSIPDPIIKAVALFVYPFSPPEFLLCFMAFYLSPILHLLASLTCHSSQQQHSADTVIFFTRHVYAKLCYTAELSLDETSLLY